MFSCRRAKIAREVCKTFIAGSIPAVASDARTGENLRNRVRAEPRVTLQTTASRAMLRIEREAVEVEAGQRPAERSSAIRSEPVGSKLREETAPPAPHKSDRCRLRLHHSVAPHRQREGLLERLNPQWRSRTRSSSSRIARITV